MEDNNTNVSEQSVQTEPAEAAETSESQEPEYLQITQGEFDKVLTDRINRALRQQKKAEDKRIEDAKKQERLASLTESQKQAEELKSLKAELAEFKEARRIAELTSDARSRLSELYSLNVSDRLLSRLVADNADDTAMIVDEFAAMFKEAVQNGINDAVRGQTSTPKNPTIGSTSTSLTIEDIMKIEDADERNKAIEDNVQLFVDAGWTR